MLVGVMRHYLVLLSSFVTATQAFSPVRIRWGGATRRFVLAPQALPTSGSVTSRVFVPPLDLTILEQPRWKSHKEAPHFVLKPDKTIAWDEGWCIEATSDNSGAAVRVNHCTGGPSQLWNLVAWDGGQKNRIQLLQTNKCISVADRKDGAFNGASVELQECHTNFASETWELEDPISVPTEGSSEPRSSMRHVVAVLALIAVGSLSLSAWFLRWSQKVGILAASAGSEPLNVDLGGVSLVVSSTRRHDSVPMVPSSDLNLRRLVPAAMALSASRVEEDAQELRKTVVNYADSLGLLGEQAEAAESGPSKEDEAAMEFPAPLTPVQRVVRALTFYSRVLPVLFRYKFEDVKLAAEKELLGKEITAEEECALWNDIDEWGSTCIYNAISDLKGFYVKTGQVISTRVDLFSEAYTEKFKQLQDGLEPMPTELVQAVVRQELLGGQPLSELFSDFEAEPLGTASIAQVHRATLLDGRVVAVKVQRPNVEAKLRGDIANLKRISKQLRDQLPVDYYTVFCELGRALEDELNFFHEAQAMRKIAAGVSHTVDGEEAHPPVSVPLPVGDLVSRRVLVMDYVEGSPLNRLQDRMKELKIDPDSPTAKLAGRRILNSLSEAFERMIFGTGFVHGDPHPGNIFVREGGRVALIDCGQVKAISRAQQLRLAETIVNVAAYQNARRRPDLYDVQPALEALADSVRRFGVEFMELEEGKNQDELAAAVAMTLFGDKDMDPPGGYSTTELDENSAIRKIASFPQELVLLGRATVLLKGISARLDVPFSLADAWAPACRDALAAADGPRMPLWGKADKPVDHNHGSEERIRMREAIKPLKAWAGGKAQSIGSNMLEKLPEGLRRNITSKVASRMLKEEEKKDEEKKDDVDPAA